jgi:hypothetical protein
VADFISATGTAPAMRVPTPECVLDGKRWPDYVMCNRTDAFFGADVSSLAAAAEQGRAHPHHAARKGVAGGEFDQLTYEAAAMHNHGKLHEKFLAPWYRKFTAGSGVPMLARYHRAAWLPLYYPETLVAAAATPVSVLAEYPMFTPANGTTAAWLQDLSTRLAALPRVRVVTPRIAALARAHDGWQFTLEEGTVVPARRIAFGTTADRLAALAAASGPAGPAAATATVRLLFARVREDAIARPAACLLVVDEDRRAHRITDFDAAAGRAAGWHRVVVECGQGPGDAGQAEALDARLLQELVELLAISGPDAVRVLKSVTAPVPLPTAASLAAHRSALAAWQDAWPGATFTGPLAGFGAGSMNDQIVQGLKIAKEWA